MSAVTVVEGLLMGFTAYFGLSTLATWILAILSRNEVERLKSMPPVAISHTPGITILVPACNEESVIEATVRALLLLNYPNLKVMIINDGSKDGTLRTLLERFQLKTEFLSARTRISPLLPREIFHSQVDPRLYVLDKPNSGKADSINCALQFVESEFFVISDADTEWTADGIQHLVAGITKSSGTVIAVGGVVGLANEKSAFLTRLQASEYQRAFFMGRLCWNSSNAVPLISGAAGLYRTDPAVQVGGLPVGSITEDLEFTINLHAFGKRHIPNYRILFIEKTVCFTHAPQTWKVLIEQRARWQRGLIQCMTRSPKLLTRSTPFVWCLEVLSAPFEWMALFLVLVALAAGVMPLASFGMILVISFMIGMINTILSAWVSYPLREHSALQLIRSGALELFGYRQILSWVRFRSMWTAFRAQPPSWRAHLVHPDAKIRKNR